MPVRHIPNPDREPPARHDLEARLREHTSDGLRWWTTTPGEVFAPHTHDRRKVLFLAEGSITFHGDGADLPLAPGDRIEVEPGTVHGATTGSSGATCVEAWA